jgi:hypothetical protein
MPVAALLSPKPAAQHKILTQIWFHLKSSICRMELLCALLAARRADLVILVYFIIIIIFECRCAYHP